MLERVQFFLLKEGGVCLYIFFGRKSLGGLRCRRAQTVGTGDGTNWLQIAAATRGWGWYLVFVQGFGNRRIYWRVCRTIKMKMDGSQWLVKREGPGQALWPEDTGPLCLVKLPGPLYNRVPRSRWMKAHTVTYNLFTHTLNQVVNGNTLILIKIFVFLYFWLLF